jgi:pyruvate formate-lyase activating enzyme-like uncharacterized protein
MNREEKRHEIQYNSVNSHTEGSVQKGERDHLSKGCILCHEGAKMVLFITGTCHRTCWYCPLSRMRKGHDDVYANEKLIGSPDEAIAVARLMSAGGTGITGGEPLDRRDRVVEYSRALKACFGPDHHIHLYTGTPPSDEDLLALVGLVDEIRLHPPYEEWESILDSEFIRSAQKAKELGFDIGIEVPALPGLEKLEPALPYLDFLNINELEWGETNADEMRSRGMEPEDGVHNAVMHAREWAEDLCRCEKVHWCSSVFKDSVQLRKRLLRIAENTARPFDEITDDGTVVYGLIERADKIIPELIRDLGDDGYEITAEGIETAWWIVTENADLLDGKKSIIERYPNRGFIVEVTPV